MEKDINEKGSDKRTIENGNKKDKANEIQGIKDIGSGSEGDPFSKRPRVIRTPPTKGRSNSIGEIGLETGLSEWMRDFDDASTLSEGDRKNKRKRRNIEKEKLKERSEYWKLVKEMRDIGKVVQELGELVGKSVNTKREIKETVKRLSWRILRMGDRMNEYGEDQEELGKVAEKREVGVQKFTSEEEEKQEKEARIRNILETGDETQVLSVMGESWTESLYKITEWTMDRTMVPEQDIVLWMAKREEQEDNRVLKDIFTLYPEVREMVEERKEGEVDFRTRELTVRGRNGEMKRGGGTVFLVTEDGESERRGMFDRAKLLKSAVEGTWRRKLKVFPMCGEKGEITRKCVEAVFWGWSEAGEGSIQVVARKGEVKTDVIETKERGERVLIKAGSKPYATLLKELKEKVDVKEVGVGVMSLRKTVKGDLMMEVKGGRGEGEKLKGRRREVKGRNY